MRTVCVICVKPSRGGATDALGGGIRRAQIGELRLDALEFAQEGIELLIADFRTCLDVVEAVVAVKFGAEKGGAAGGFGVDHGCALNTCKGAEGNEKSFRETA